MTLAEFKIWFDGVIFAIGDRPSKEQWAQIVEKLKSVDEAKVVTYQAYSMLETDLSVEILDGNRIQVNFSYLINDARIGLITYYLDYLRVTKYYGLTDLSLVKDKIKKEVLDFIVFLERQYH